MILLFESRSEYTAFVEPENVITYNKNMSGLPADAVDETLYIYGECRKCQPII